jgi:hypothetical protein
MAFGLDNLSDGQRKALLIGVPAVALVAVGVRFGKGSTPPPAAPADDQPSSTPPTGYLPPASTDAIGVGQLADFESHITQLISNLGQQQTPTTTTPSGVRLCSKYPQSNVPYSCDRCPDGYILEAGPNGWTCATPAQHANLMTYLASVR